MMADIFELFPTPVMRVPALLAPSKALVLGSQLAQTAALDNNHSTLLTHSRLLAPGEDAAIDGLIGLVGPHLQAFGELVFGESLNWLVKEMWVNVLQAGGHQVRTTAEVFAAMDEAGTLGKAFGPPKGADEALIAKVEQEEGWILGA